jgi:hypothetical protein
MAARATRYSAQVLRTRPSTLPVPPAHRGAMLSSLIWSLSTPSASLPYLRPTPCPAPAFSRVIKRGMATIQKSKQFTAQDSDDEALARFHRAVRDESESYIDMWSLPLETLGALPSLEYCHSLLSSDGLLRLGTISQWWLSLSSRGTPNANSYHITDVHIPSFPARVENATLRDHIALLRDNFLNTLKNVSRCVSPFPHSSKSLVPGGLLARLQPASGRHPAPGAQMPPLLS